VAPNRLYKVTITKPADRTMVRFSRKNRGVKNYQPSDGSLQLLEDLIRWYDLTIEILLAKDFISIQVS